MLMLDKSQKHLDSVHESYFQHLCYAACFGVRLIGAGVAAILHGLCPAVFQYKASAAVFALHDELKQRRQRGEGETHG